MKKKVNIFLGILAERKVDVCHYIIEVGYSYSYFHLILEGKEQDDYILILCCQLSKRRNFVNLNFRGQEYIVYIL